MTASQNMADAIALSEREIVDKNLNGRWKVSGYRPFGIIARDPTESTYQVGDDTFPVLIDVRGTFAQQRALAHRIVRDHNAALRESLPEERPE